MFAFLFGGIGGYLVVALIAARHLAPVTPVRMRKTTLVNLFAAVAAVAVSVVAQFVHSPILGFFIAGFTSTLVYILSLAIVLHLTMREAV